MSHSIEPICYLFIDLFTYNVITFSKHLYKQYIIAIISTESVNLMYYINKSSNHNRYRSWGILYSANRIYFRFLRIKTSQFQCLVLTAMLSFR